MTLRNYQDYPLNLLAGVEQELAVSGSYWQIVTAPSPVQLVFDESRRVTRPAGSGGPASYNRVRVRSAVDQAVVISLGFIDGVAPYDRGNSVFTGTINVASSVPSTTASPPDVSIPPGTQVLLMAAGATRRSVLLKLITECDSGIRIGDSSTAANRGYQLDTGDSANVDGTAALYAFNPNAIAVTVCLLNQTLP